MDLHGSYELWQMHLLKAIMNENSDLFCKLTSLIALRKFFPFDINRHDKDCSWCSSGRNNRDVLESKLVSRTIQYRVMSSTFEPEYFQKILAHLICVIEIKCVA